MRDLGRSLLSIDQRSLTLLHEMCHFLIQGCHFDFRYQEERLLALMQLDSKHIQPYYWRDLIHNLTVSVSAHNIREAKPRTNFCPINYSFCLCIRISNFTQMLNLSENFLAKCPIKTFWLLALLTPLKEYLEIPTCYKGFQATDPR